MKKIFIGAVALCMMVMVSCSGNHGVEKGRDDSARIADSIAQVEAAKAAAEQARLDSIRQDSIMQKQIDDEYKNGLNVTVGKTKSVNGEGTYNELTMTFIVENNTNITWEADDYDITFKVEEEYQTEEDDLDVKWFTKKAHGKNVLPGEKITIIHKDSGWYPKDIKIKTKLIKEAFAEKFKENTTFDTKLNKFVAKYQYQ